MMPTCGNCSAAVQDGDEFCVSCGAALVQVATPADLNGVHLPAAVLVKTRPQFERMAEHLDPIASRFVAAAARQAVVFAVLTLGASVIVKALGAGNGLVGLIVIVATIAYFVLRIPVSLSEWKILIEDQGPRAQEVFGHVAHVLRRRRVPVDSIKVRQLSQPGHPRHDYLQVRHGILTAYVTCFPYGTDLYLGWSLWWRFSPLHYIAMVVGRRWQKYTVRGSELHLLHRYDIAKAMREAMHAAAIEAVDVAEGRRPAAPPPSDLPVETVSIAPPPWDPQGARSGA